jgi:hypothetical protein
MVPRRTSRPTVRRHRPGGLAGESPAAGSAGAPRSRHRVTGEILASEWCNSGRRLPEAHRNGAPASIPSGRQASRPGGAGEAGGDICWRCSTGSQRQAPQRCAAGNGEAEKRGVGLQGMHLSGDLCGRATVGQIEFRLTRVSNCDERVSCGGSKWAGRLAFRPTREKPTSAKKTLENSLVKNYGVRVGPATGTWRAHCSMHRVGAFDVTPAKRARNHAFGEDKAMVPADFWIVVLIPLLVAVGVTI